MSLNNNLAKSAWLPYQDSKLLALVHLFPSHRNQVFGACCFAQMAHKPVFSKSDKCQELSVLIYIYILWLLRGTYFGDQFVSMHKCKDLTGGLLQSLVRLFWILRSKIFSVMGLPHFGPHFHTARWNTIFSHNYLLERQISLKFQRLCLKCGNMSFS